MDSEITDKQRVAFKKSIENLFPGNSLNEVLSDPSLRNWWKATYPIIYCKMKKIDEDQMKSRSSLPLIPVGCVGYYLP